MVLADTSIWGSISYGATHKLFGLGRGYVDAHLLAATALAHGAVLKSRDKRPRAAAHSVGTGGAELS
jgi:predicted nucleic acid-binding protein